MVGYRYTDTEGAQAMTIMPFEGLHVDDADTYPFTAAQDEASYCESILPVVATDEWPTIDTRDDEAHEALSRQEPIPGHFHYLDAGFWG